MFRQVLIILLLCTMPLLSFAKDKEESKSEPFRCQQPVNPSAASSSDERQVFALLFVVSMRLNNVVTKGIL